MSIGPKEQPTRRTWPAGLGVLALMLLLTLAHTWPLAAHWNQAIPYVYHPSPGWELVPEMPGDHLQFYYWSWLFTDNLTGPSSFPSNPYEFNTFLHPQGIALYANFPFSLLYLALKPLGALSAYNAVVLVTYLLAGLAAYALARRLLGSALAALPVALIYALLPFRASQALSGHLYGFIAFMLPATLWCLEKGWERRSAWWGPWAACCCWPWASWKATCCSTPPCSWACTCPCACSPWAHRVSRQTRNKAPRRPRPCG